MSGRYHDEGDRKEKTTVAARAGSKSLYAQELLAIRNRSKSPSPYDKGHNNNEIDYGPTYGSLNKQPQHSNALELMKKMRSNQSSSPERSPSTRRKRSSSPTPEKSKSRRGRATRRSKNNRSDSSKSSSGSSGRANNTASNRNRSGSAARQCAMPLLGSKKNNYENLIKNRSSFHTNNSDDTFRAKLQMLCNVGLIKDHERNQVTKDFLENVWLEFSKLKGAQKMIQSYNKERSLRRDSRSESSRSRESSGSDSSRSRKSPRRKKLTRDVGLRNKPESNTVISGYKNGGGGGPFMKVTELLSFDDTTSLKQRSRLGGGNAEIVESQVMKDSVKKLKESEAAKKVCESLRRQDMQIELLEQELEKIEQAIEKQFKPGRDRDEATLEEQIRLGRELKLQIDKVERERIKLRDKLSTKQLSARPPEKRIASPRKSLVKDKEVDEEEESFEYYDGGDHWCRMCNDSCNTIIQFLSHLHTTQHRQRASAYGERPWMKLRDSSENLPSSQKKSATPFLGSEFVIPVVGFFCKLCMEFTGDIADCEEHLVGDYHNNNYRMHFIGRNLLQT